MSKSTITEYLNTLENNNTSLQELFNALTTLSQLELQPHQFKIMLAPLVDFMGELLADNETVIFAIDDLQGMQA